MRSRWAILWAIVLILGGVLLLAQNFRWLGQFEASTLAVAVGGLGVLFLLDFITAPGRDWWALIPGCVLMGIAVTIYLGNRGIGGEWTSSVMLFSIGLPFLLIYLVKRGTFWWALIPGGVMTVLAVIPILSLQVSEGVVGAFVMWAIAIPFWVVFLANRRNWWAIIPAGALTVIGAMPLLSARVPGQFVGGVFFIGLAAVFGLIYLLNLRDPQMAWAVYPAVVLLGVGIGMMVFGQNWWPLVIIALGLALLIRAILPRST